MFQPAKCQCHALLVHVFHDDAGLPHHDPIVHDAWYGTGRAYLFLGWGGGQGGRGWRMRVRTQETKRVKRRSVIASEGFGKQKPTGGQPKASPAL